MKIKLFKNICLPRKSHVYDAGLDLFLPEGFTIKPLETLTVGLGFGVLIPEGFTGMIIPRSSIAQKGLIVQTSAIDSDYVGEIHLIITNSSNIEYSFKKNQRVCSLICIPILNPHIEIVDNLQSTTRGLDRLGSTGK